MGKFDRYVERAREYIRMPDAEVREPAPNVTLVISGAKAVPEGTEFGVYVHGLDAHGMEGYRKSLVINPGDFLYDHVVIFEGNIPIRSHQETGYEIVKNLGVPVMYRVSKDGTVEGKPMKTHEVMHSVVAGKGFFHGFRVLRDGDVGLFYVVKALKPEFRDGKHFIMPENTYRGAQ